MPFQWENTKPLPALYYTDVAERTRQKAAIGWFEHMTLKRLSYRAAASTDRTVQLLTSADRTRSLI